MDAIRAIGDGSNESTMGVEGRCDGALGTTVVEFIAREGKR